MAEYDRVQKKQESRAIANSGSRHLNGHVKNRLKGNNIYQLMPASSDLYIRSDNAAGRKFNLRKDIEYKMTSTDKVYTKDETEAFSGGMSSFESWKSLPYKDNKAIWKISKNEDMEDVQDVKDVEPDGHHSLHLINSKQKTMEEEVFKNHMQSAAIKSVFFGKFKKKVVL